MDACIPSTFRTHPVGTGKTKTARDVTGFYVLGGGGAKSGNFLHILGISLLNCTVNLEKRAKYPLEKIHKKKPVETAPRNCRFLSLVVLARVLHFM